MIETSITYAMLQSVFDLELFVKVIRMLMIVLVVFTVCWAPYLLAQVIYNTDYFNYDISPSRRNKLHNANRYFSLLSLANSAVNPILYGLLSRY